MARPGFKSVDDYIAAQPREAQPTLQRVRAAIRKALPKAEEVISYQIPTYKLQGSYVIYFAGFKQHFSVYPAGARLVADMKDELEPYEYNNKGTIRFPLDKPPPVGLIGRIAKYRAQEVKERLLAKAPNKKAAVKKR
jgi:uncharacterized protein YdhG (YjbR/CyaY superfamily)